MNKTMKISKLVQWKFGPSLVIHFISLFVLSSTFYGFAGKSMLDSDVTFSQQQKKQVSGTVLDEDGEAVIGANVVEKGTTNGTVSDINGHFSLAIENDGVLQITYIGYLVEKVSTVGNTVFTITLQEDTKMLAEVVVIGYGSLDKRQVTSAITSLKGDDMMVGVGGADITSVLQGKIGGLVMNNLGSANSGTTIQLRGMTSINAGLLYKGVYHDGDSPSVYSYSRESFQIPKCHRLIINFDTFALSICFKSSALTYYNSFRDRSQT